MSDVICVTYNSLKYSSSPIAVVLRDLLPVEAQNNQHTKYYIKLELITSEYAPLINV